MNRAGIERAAEAPERAHWRSRAPLPLAGLLGGRLPTARRLLGPKGAEDNRSDGGAQPALRVLGGQLTELLAQAAAKADRRGRWLFVAARAVC